MTQLKPIQNFRDHPSLQYDSHQSIFTIKQKLYLHTEQYIRRIIPVKIQRTTIGDPFRELARFVFVIGGNEDSTNLDMVDVLNLVLMCKAIDIDLPVSQEFEKLLE